MTFKKVQESKEIGKEIVEGQEVAILQPEVHREVENKKTGADYDSEEAAKADEVPSWVGKDHKVKLSYIVNKAEEAQGTS